MAQLTEMAIDKIRSLIIHGDLPPGARLPPEQEALEARDPALARAAALLHVSTTENFVRRVLADSSDV